MRRFVIIALFLFLAMGSAGAQWEIEESHTTANLLSVESVDVGVSLANDANGLDFRALNGAVAWSSGSNGTVLRTIDGGKLWQVCTTPPGAEYLNFRSIHGFGADFAIVMSSGLGDQSRVYRTTDGCLHWTLVFSNPDKEGHWDAMQFSMEIGTYKTGYILGRLADGRLAIFNTRDGGSSWQRYESIPKISGEDSSSTSYGSMVLWGSFPRWISNSGSVPQIYRAEFYAISDDVFDFRWKPGMDNLVSGKGAYKIGAIAPAVTWNQSGRNRGGRSHQAGYGVAVGGNGSDQAGIIGAAWFTVNDGKTWQPARTPPHGFRSAVAYNGTKKTWITVGPNGTDISSNDGMDWHSLKPGPSDASDADRNWVALSLPFAVGSGGRIGKLRSDTLKP
jgi:hypothetical protein